MQILANQNFPGEAVEALRAAGHEVLWIQTDAPGLEDRAVLARAAAEGRLVITFDKDFGELAIVRRIPHSGIIRLVNLGARQQAPACLRVINLHEEELKAAAIITVEPSRLRIRLAADQSE